MITDMYLWKSALTLWSWAVRQWCVVLATVFSVLFLLFLISVGGDPQKYGENQNYKTFRTPGINKKTNDFCTTSSWSSCYYLYEQPVGGQHVVCTQHIHKHAASVVCVLPGWRRLMFGVNARCWGSSSGTGLRQRTSFLTFCLCWMPPWSARTPWSWLLPSAFSWASVLACLLSAWQPWSECVGCCWLPVGVFPERWGSLPFATSRSVRIIHIQGGGVYIMCSCH